MPIKKDCIQAIALEYENRRKNFDNYNYVLNIQTIWRTNTKKRGRKRYHNQLVTVVIIFKVDASYLVFYRFYATILWYKEQIAMWILVRL